MRYTLTLICAAALVAGSTKLAAQPTDSNPVPPAAASTAAAPKPSTDRPLPPALVGVVTQDEFNAYNRWHAAQLEGPEWTAIKKRSEELRKEEQAVFQAGRDLRAKQLAANPEMKAIYEKINDAIKANNMKLHNVHVITPSPAGAPAAPAGSATIVVPGLDSAPAPTPNK